MRMFRIIKFCIKMQEKYRKDKQDQQDRMEILKKMVDKKIKEDIAKPQ